MEGEKSAEAASTFYVGPVTTWCGGAKAVSKTDFGPLRGRDVVLCPDNDDPGRNAMAQAAALLHAIGANVKIVNLLELAKARPSGPDIPEGWDVADALQEDWAPEALREALESCALPYDANTEKFVAPVARVAPMEPLPLYPPLALPEPYPIEALGCTLGNVAQAIANKCQVPEAMAAQSVLAVASLIGQPHANVILPFGQTRPISLYIITVAGSGDRKSTADNEALRGIIEHEGVLRTKYDADFQEFLASEAAYNAEKRRIETRKDKTFTREDRLKALRELGAKPEKPLHPIHTVGDPTIEGLIKNWAELRAGLGLFSAEGGQFTGGHGMAEENRLRTAAHLSCLWDGTPVKRLRAGDGATLLLGRRLSLHMMVQVSIASTFLSDPVLRDQGLLSRTLVAAPPSLAGTRYHKPVSPQDEQTIIDFQATTKALFSISIPLIEGKRNEAAPRELSLDDGAAGAFFRFHDHVEGQMGKDGDLEALRDVGAKAPENAARIAAILTLMDNIAAPFISEAAMQQEIGRAHV